MLYATKRRINSVWTVVYEHTTAGKVRILKYSRDIEAGYEREKDLPRCSLVETGERVVTHLILAPYADSRYCASEVSGAETFEVENPQFVFSYGD